MNEFFLALVVGTTARWAAYTLLLWIMIKIQKIQYSGFGLLASSAAAVLTSFIPVVGSYASYVVLLLCLKKATHASLAPDLLFTVVIAGALMFCVDLWALGALMGKLGCEARPVLVIEAAEPETEPKEIAAGSGLSTEAEVAEEKEPVLTRVKAHPSGLMVKGISFSEVCPFAMLEADGRIFTVAPGEGFAFSSSRERIHVRCQEVRRGSVFVELNDSDQVELLFE